MKTLRAGDLRHSIVFQERVETQSGPDVIITWQDTSYHARCSIEPLSGIEFFEAQAVNERMTTRFKMYYISGIDTSMRILDKNSKAVYDIQSIIPDSVYGNYTMEIIGHRINTEEE